MLRENASSVILLAQVGVQMEMFATNVIQLAVHVQGTKLMTVLIAGAVLKK